MKREYDQLCAQLHQEQSLVEDLEGRLQTMAKARATDKEAGAREWEVLRRGMGETQVVMVGLGKEKVGMKEKIEAMKVRIVRG